MKKKIIHNSKRCPDCNHTIRWVRTDNLWKCLRCPSEFTDAELKSKKPYSDEPDYIEDNPAMAMFNKPASQVMAPVIPVVTASPITAPLLLPVKVKPIEQTIYPDLVDSTPDTDMDTNAPDLIVDKVWTPSSDGEQSFDVNELFVYHPKVEVKTSPQRMAMPTMAAPAQRAEVLTFDTGRQVYSLRSER